MQSHRAEPLGGWDRAALETVERARARTLVELLNEAGVDVREGVAPALLARRTSLLHRLNAKTERALRQRAASPAERSALEEERFALQRDLDAVEAEIRAASPGYAALTQPQALSAAALQGLLDPDTLLLSYALGEARSYLWAVTPQTIESFELPGRAAIEALTRRVHEEMSRFDVAARGRESADVEALGRVLLGPVAGRLGPLGEHRLVVVPDGALHYVPFGALLLPAGDGGTPEPVLARHEVVALPSASALAVQRRLLAGRPPAAKRLAMLADPVFDPHDPRVAGRHPAARRTDPPAFARLPASRREAEAIMALAPAGPAGQTMLALDFDAALPRVLGDALLGFRVVHFATHGVIDAERPALGWHRWSTPRVDLRRGYSTCKT